jgi:hypothetical protein
MAVVIFCIVVYFIYSLIKNRDLMLSSQVDSIGGMMNKYRYLVEQLCHHPDAKVIRLGRDHIHIVVTNNGGIRHEFLITENFGVVDIE